jgi:hypothetical protein
MNGLPASTHGQGAHWRLSSPVVSLLRAAHGPLHRDEILRRFSRTENCSRRSRLSGRRTPRALRGFPGC